MHIPKHFAQEDRDALHALMRAHPLAALVTTGPDGPVADHVPLELFPDEGELGVLRGHVARANPLWRTHDPNTPVLAIFQGPEGYVSPSWYRSKAEHGRVVPTWNYRVAHARGPLRVIDDPAWLRALVTRLTDRHEASQPEPWRVDDAPGDYVDGLLRAIVGVEIPVTRLEGKWKTSQNRSDDDRAEVARRLPWMLPGDR